MTAAGEKLVPDLSNNGRRMIVRPQSRAFRLPLSERGVGKRRFNALRLRHRLVDAIVRKVV
ncbi:MAG: hypothetical protein AAFY05_03750 [Pseudomonadota bacterium]